MGMCLCMYVFPCVQEVCVHTLRCRRKAQGQLSGAGLSLLLGGFPVLVGSSFTHWPISLALRSFLDFTFLFFMAAFPLLGKQSHLLVDISPQFLPPRPPSYTGLRSLATHNNITSCLGATLIPMPLTKPSILWMTFQFYHLIIKFCFLISKSVR